MKNVVNAFIYTTLVYLMSSELRRYHARTMYDRKAFHDNATVAWLSWIGWTVHTPATIRNPADPSPRPRR